MNIADLGAADAMRRWVGRHRPRLLLSLRIVLASVLTFAIAHLLDLAKGYWAVLTAVIVIQSSVGGSIKATTDRLLGSLGGAVWGVCVCLAIPHAGVLSLGLALAAAVTPLAVATAFNPAWRVAPVTAIILLLTPTSQAHGPVYAAIQRMLEVGLGSIVAVLVAAVLAPGGSRQAVRSAAATALEAMAELLILLMNGLAQGADQAAVEALHAKIRAEIAKAEVAADETRRERIISLIAGSDPTPLCRTLRRLRHDLATIGRSTRNPLPSPIRERLTEPAAATADAMARFLRQSAAAIERASPPPSTAPEREALAGFAAAVAELRASGLARALSDEDVARLFGLAFGLEQLGQNLDDLTARVAELADPSRGS
jgi:uncharacterized membrane protein YccC